MVARRAARHANEAVTEVSALPIRPAEVARVVELVAEGKLNDQLARQVIEGVLAGDGSPDEIVAARDLAVVSDDAALGDAVDDAIAANPDIAEKVRSGRSLRLVHWSVRS